MTKLRWEKADEYLPDPGATIEVEESTRPERWTPPEERKRKEAERAKRNRELREKSERHDRELLIKPVLARIRNKQDRGIPLSGWEKLILRDREGSH